MTAGKRLAAKYAKALVRASQDAREQLEWTEPEATALALASESADAAERVKALLDAELGEPEPNPNTSPN